MGSAATIAASPSQVQAISLANDGVVLLDQVRLPHELRYIKIMSADEMRHAIVTMVVRGAPAIGIAGAFGVVLSAREHAKAYPDNVPACVLSILVDADLLAQTRPTAVNLQWAINRMKRVMSDFTGDVAETLCKALEQEAQAIFDEDLAMCEAIGRHGKEVVPKSAQILTHCNAGALATAGYGTALGVVRAAFQVDPTIHVYASETRPRLQGARLTTWELQQEGIPVTLIADNMAAWLMKQGQVDMVIVGADRIAKNGDTANKIGTYSLALLARAHNIPFYVAAPSSTIDLSIETGDEIPIETRHADEVAWIHDETICPEGIPCYNPAFDVTPAELITGIITENGLIKTP